MCIFCDIEVERKEILSICACLPLTRLPPDNWWVCAIHAMFSHPNISNYCNEHLTLMIVLLFFGNLHIPSSLRLWILFSCNSHVWFSAWYHVWASFYITCKNCFPWPHFFSMRTNDENICTYRMPRHFWNLQNFQVHLAKTLLLLFCLCWQKFDFQAAPT